MIQNREIQRVGSPEVKHVDVRLVAATNRDPRAEVLAGRFREDLFYRLSSIEIRVPGLAERPEDIPVLVQHFLKKYSQAYGKAFQGLTQRASDRPLAARLAGAMFASWKTQFQALRSAVTDFIDVTDLPEHLQKPRRAGNSTQDDWRPLPLDEVRQIHIRRVLEMCNGNRVRAAQVLGIGRTSLYRFLKRKSKPPVAVAKGAA